MNELLPKPSTGANETWDGHQVAMFRLAERLNAQSEELVNQLKELAEMLKASAAHLKLESKRLSANGRAGTRRAARQPVTAGGKQ